ncbi:FAD-dependent thymidylate synthase [Candidatus Nanohalovita haloferacivicina]|uniref:FAD-dependent thymidylate synthase n=1 Tax=Candidatus Nanohalovita haloferacivicina TaxID=2978046 RepID=UPI00325FA4AB|nr:Thymidylate synthase, domain duplication [Candidatus Nanohalobia archaeon BNXNv]
MTEFSETEKKALSNFVTHTEENIYAVQNVSPEIFGAFGSFFSRSPKDIREHLLDAIKGNIRGHKIEGGEERLEKLARTADEKEGDIYEHPQKGLQSGLEKSQSFFEKYYGTYGHKSIANTVWIPFVANDVSQIFARKLAEDQLAFFIEQSTRYVEFDKDNYYKDPDIMESEHSEKYTETIEKMTENYKEFTEIAKEYYREQLPYEEWLEKQSEETQEKSEGFLERKYKRELDGKALDIARFLLPQAIQTNIAWALDARSTEFDIASWKSSPLSEMNDAAEKLEDSGGQIAPSLLKYTEKSEYRSDKLNLYNGEFEMDSEGEEIEKGVEIISAPENLLNKLVAHTLKENNSCSFKQAFQKSEEMSYNEKIDVLERTVEGRNTYDEWVGRNEEYDIEKLTIEIKTDVGALRDLRRHQKNDRGENIYSLDMGYYRPEVVDEMPEKAGELFEETMQIAHEAEKQIREDFKLQAQYVLPMATMTTITMSIGLDQLQYFVNLRSTPEGNFSYREDAFNLAEEAAREYPWLLGLEEYPEGKGIKDVYRNAPVKELMRIQPGETDLHT